MTPSPRPGRVLRYYWREPSSGSNPWRNGQRVIGQDMFSESRFRTPDYLLGRTPPPWAEDLLRIARAAFVVDKAALRGDADGGWTRDLSLSVPVDEPALWKGEPLDRLTRLLETMTGDRWDITLRGPTKWQPWTQTLEEPATGPPPEVALFSGGLDSLSWAAQRATKDPETPLILITFGEKVAKGAQEAAEAAVRDLARREQRRVQLHPRSQDVEIPGQRKGVRGNEDTTRTRALLYSAMAIRTAAGEGAATVQAPENGQIALNPPLSAARSAACSTRSVHPWTLHLLNALIAALDGGVTVKNPLGLLTKGEVCQAAREAGLNPEDLEATVSCGRSPKNQPGGQDDLSCGRCWPCLVRRAGLHYALGGDRSPYWREPSEAVGGAQEDWVDLVRWLRDDFCMADLIADTPLPSSVNRAEAFGVIARGRAELRAWLASLGVQL